MKMHKFVLSTLWLIILSILVLGSSGAQASVVQASSSVYITTQKFERGLMVWRQDNGTIYVLDDHQQATIFPLASYAFLPENPIAVPLGRVKPLFGFGKVWARHSSVRQRLGYPLLPEIGFETSWSVEQDRISFTQLDRSIISILYNGSWVQRSAADHTPVPDSCPYPMFFPFENEGICPNAPISTDAAYQTFEHGFMIWTSHTEDVWVFTNSSEFPASGKWWRVPNSEYEQLPDASVPTPEGKIAPINAFGRVWANANRPLVQILGWPTNAEIAYRATIQLWGRTGIVTDFVSLPNGNVVEASSGSNFGMTWMLRLLN